MSDSPPSSLDWRDEIESSLARVNCEQRSQSRSNCNIPALVAIEGDDDRRKAVVRNLSAIGAFLETDPIPVGTRLKMVLADAALRTAEVVWLEDPGPATRVRTIRGIGVRFLSIARGTQS
jgi:PilZ domain